MIPLTVIGGFLGAGKTTLVNHLLATGGKRWGVLVNDFGAINIDAALIAASDGQTMALTNGCVCCNMGDDLGDGLAAMAARIPPPEHVIVEASGVSDPWRIAQMALIEPGFALEPLVVLADATALPAQLDDRWTGDTVARQLAFAEIVVITKIDLADAAQLAMVHARIAELRPQARVIETAHASLPDAALSFTPPARPPASRFQADEMTHAFPTQRIAADQPFDRDRLRRVLEMLPASVLRLKGVCLLDTGRVLLQYAAERWAFTPAPNGLANGLVAIGTPQMPDLGILFSGAR